MEFMYLSRKIGVLVHKDINIDMIASRGALLEPLRCYGLIGNSAFPLGGYSVFLPSVLRSMTRDCKSSEASTRSKRM